MSLFVQLQRRFGRPVDEPTRREFLKASLATGAALLLSGPRAFAQSKPSGKSVIVIGAGFAGLAAAYELLSVGYDVTVVEARGGGGGRVLSFNEFVKDRVIEGGGELVGSNHPTWVAYAAKFGLKLAKRIESEDTTPIILDGKLLNDEDAEKIWKEMEAAMASMNKDAEAVVEDEPWKTPNAAALDHRSTADWLKGVEASEMTKRGVAAQLVADNGVSLEKQSYLGNLAQVKGGGGEKFWTETEVYRCEGGNQQLAKKLQAAIGENRLNFKLPATDVTLRNSKVMVKCADGREITADDCIVAVPPSVWSKIRFTPGLPPAMAPQMGNNIKYLVSLKNRFWKEAKLSPDALGDGKIQMTWDSLDHMEEDAPAAMVAFSGAASCEAMRAVPKEKRDEAYKTEMTKFYPTYGDAFVASRFMDWPSDPWLMAGYSFPAPGQVTTVGPLMHTGIENRIHFAGEHTCYKFVGYMEGGLNSGVSIAKRLAVRDGIAKG